MKQEEMTERIIDYFDNTLSEEDRKAFEEKMNTSPDFAAEVAEYQKLFDSIEKEGKQLPSARLQTNFSNMLKVEKGNQAQVVSIGQERKNWMAPILKLAAGIALLISIFYLGHYSQQQQTENSILIVESERLQAQQMAVLAMLENQSASKRIQGVQYTEEFKEPDQDIVLALADRMRFDENTNVRMAALEALSKFSNSIMVKEVFLKTLETEKNPSIQIALIQNLVEMQEKKAVAPMKKLLEKEDTQPFIKAEINQALPKII